MSSTIPAIAESDEEDEASDVVEPLYSDEYIQSIYSSATAGARGGTASTAASSSSATTTTKHVSIAADTRTLRSKGREQPQDEDEELALSDRSVATSASFHMPVPPAMMNHSPPRITSSSSSSGGDGIFVAPGTAVMRPQPSTPTRSIAASKVQQPLPPVLKKRTATVASNTTTTSTSSSTSIPRPASTTSAATTVVDQRKTEKLKTKSNDDDDAVAEPLPATTGPFVVPVPKKSNHSSSRTAATPVTRSNSSRRPPPPHPTVTANNNDNNNGGSSGATGRVATATATMALVWNRVFRRYYSLKLVGMLLAIYTAVLSFTYIGTFGKYGGVIDPETGYIIDTNSETNTADGIIVLENGVKRAVVAETSFELVALVIARLTAFYMYPALVMVFFTKFRATMQLISKTPLSMFTYEDLHELHVFSGWTILINGLAHTVFHLARWASQKNLTLLWEHYSGLSGLIVTVSMCLVCIPMLIYKKEVRYEIRKGLHYFFILFCLGMCFHAPTASFPNGGFATWGFATVLLWWILDFAYCHMFMTEKIDSTIFHVVPTGVQLTMRVSERFQRTGVRGGYCYVNFPWLSRYEWHAFSLFENPANPAERQIFMEKLGDWTSKLHKTLQRDTTRPIWVQGPFSSPYDSADEYDHQILVAGGIGITPALSVMRAHKTTRRTNLIWAVRDPHMLEFFLRRAEFSERGWNLIFYTGKEQTYVGEQSDIITSTGARVHIIKSRPDFSQLIPNIIYSIESKKSVPEAYIPDAKIEAVQFLKERLLELDQESFLDNRDKIRALVEDAESFGFLFTDLVTEFFGEDVSTTLQQSLKVAEGSYLMDDTVGTSQREMNPLIGEGLSRARGDETSSKKRSVIVNEEQILSGLRKIDRGHSVRFFCEAPGTLSPRNASMRSLVRGLSIRNVSTRNIVSYERMMGPRQESMSTRAWKAVTMAADDWAKEHVPTFKPWEENPSEAKAYVKVMDPEILKCWGMLYCGGKSPLATNASNAATDFGLEMHMESFAW